MKRFVDLSPPLERKPTAGWSPLDWRLETLLEPTHSVANRADCRLDEREVRWIELWNDFLRRTRGVDLPGHPLWSSYWHIGAAVDPTAPVWKQRYERQNIDFYRANRPSVDAWLRRHGNELRSFPTSRQKLEWQAQDMPRDLRLGLLHFRPSGIRVKKATYTPALVAMAQTPVYGPEGRRLTTRETARLQGFPDWFEFPAQPDAETYRQLGNAVHVGAMVHVVRQHVRRHADLIEDRPGGPELVSAVRGAAVMPEVPRPGGHPFL